MKKLSGTFTAAEDESDDIGDAWRKLTGGKGIGRFLLTLLALGAKHVVASAECDVVAEVKRITTGKGARVVFDPVGGDAFEVRRHPNDAVGASE